MENITLLQDEKKILEILNATPVELSQKEWNGLKQAIGGSAKIRTAYIKYLKAVFALVKFDRVVISTQWVKINDHTKYYYKIDEALTYAYFSVGNAYFRGPFPQMSTF